MPGTVLSSKNMELNKNMELENEYFVCLSSIRAQCISTHLRKGQLRKY